MRKLNFSGYENLKLIANLYKGVGKERIDEVVKLVKLENRIYDKVSKYSLGMRQRLGVAQAYAEHRFLLKGDIKDAMSFVRVIDRTEGYLFPKFITKGILKQIPKRE